LTAGSALLARKRCRRRARGGAPECGGLAVARISGGPGGRPSNPALAVPGRAASHPPRL